MKTLLFLSVFLTSGLFCQIPSYVPLDGLVGWWPFNGNADDESGNGNDGLVIGPMLTEDRDGNSNSAYEFSGTYTDSDVITGDCSSFPDGNTSRTISFWYYANDLESGTVTQAIGYGGNSCGQSFNMNFNNPDAGSGKYEVQGHCLAFHTYTDIPSPINNFWHNLTVTYNSSVFKFYNDGILVFESSPTSLNVFTESKIFCFGKQSSQNGNNVYTAPSWKGFDGKLDDIGIWDRVLTECEILQLSNASPLVTATGSDTILCYGEALTLTGEEVVTYEWDGGVIDGEAFIPEVGEFVYTVIGTDDSGCESADSIEIVVYDLPDLEITSSDTALCHGEELTLTGEGAVTYVWDEDVVDGEAFVPELGEHVYTVIGTNDNGCEITDSIDIVVYDIPDIEIISSDTALCHGEELTLTGEGAITYEWDEGVVDGEAFSPEVGEYLYTVIGTDDNGCEITDSIDIVVYDIPDIEIISSDTALCYGEELTLTGEGAITYEWDEGVIDGEAFSPEVGIYLYTVIGTDDNGCEDTASIEIIVNDNPAISSTTIIPELFGEDGSIDITISGGTPAYSFDWDNDGTGDFDDDEDLTSISGGTYIVVVEDEAGCTVTHSVTVNSQLNIEGDQAINLMVYPNPTSSVVTISFEGAFVYSLVSNDSKVLVSNKGINQVQVDLSEFADGIYFLEITTENRNRSIQLIKQ